MNRPSKGLTLDTFSSDVNEQSVTYALNAQVDDKVGNPYHYQNEIGNRLIRYISGTIYGVVNMERGEQCIFSQNGLVGEIGILTKDNYVTKYTDSGLNFTSWIKGEYRLLNGCDRVIYFIDGINPDRVINLDRVNLIQSVNELRLQSAVKKPVVDSAVLQNSGGLIEIGSYSFAARLVDELGNAIVTSDISDEVFTNVPNLNLGVFDSDSGGINRINKSIQLTINNVDTNYPYIKLFVLAAIEGNGVAVYELPNLIPTSQSISFTYTGLSGALRSTIDSLLVDPVVYDTSQALTIVDKRLVRANVSSNYKDFSTLQRAANTVKLEWTSQAISKYEAKSTFQSDEIYAFAIQYAYSDNTFSPAFHIPGVEPDSTDLQVKNFPISEAQYLTVNPVTSGNNVSLPNWKVYSTARPDGRFGYYQTNETYPTTKDCNGNFIYGDLQGKPVRYHRFPSKANLPINTQLGVKATVTLPTGTIGYRLLYVPRDPNNRTVNTGGILFQNANYATGSLDANSGDTWIEFDRLNLPLKNSSRVTVFTPEDLANKAIRADYISIVKNIDLTSLGETDADYALPSGINRKLRVQAEILNPVYSNQTEVYEKVNNSYYIDLLSEFIDEQNKTLVNLSFSNNVNFLNLNYKAVVAGTNKYILKKQIITPYQNLTTLNYKLLHTDIKATTATFYNGDTFITPFQVHNIYFRGTDRNGLFSKSDYVFKGQTAPYWVESDINFSLRINGLNQFLTYTGGDLITYYLNKLAVVDSTGISPRFDAIQLKNLVLNTLSSLNSTDTLGEYYYYNQDYRKHFLGKIYPPVPLTYNYCNLCSNKFQNRIVWSLASFSEETKDNFRIYLSENFTTVGTSPITALYYDRNRLLVRSTKNIFALSPNPQQLNTDVGALYIGSGDFLSIPPAQMVKTDYGFGGGLGFLDHCTTEFGWVTVDSQTGQVFLFSDGFKELTDFTSGCQQWFKENLPLNITEGYIQVAYDPRFKRLILSKYDYKQIDSTIKKKNGVYYKDDYQVDFTFNNYFENKSYTISYSFIFDSFISFHSYFPSLMFSDYDGLYVIGDNTIGRNSIWKHDSQNYQRFFNSKKDFIVEYNIHSQQTSDLEVVEYYAQSLIGEQDVDYPTFDRFMVYTKQQSTGLQKLIPKPLYTTGWNNQTKVVTAASQNYRIAAIRDLSTSNLVYSKNWADIKNNYFTDKVPVNINYNMSQWNQIPINDKYFYIRLFFNPTDNVKIILDLTNSSNRLKEM